jgi:hypothetical protein
MGSDNMMQELKLTVGFSPCHTAKEDLKALGSFRPYIYDLHFPHYNPQICASGRVVDAKIPLDTARKRTLDLISWNQKHTQFKLTLLLNYLLHDNYKVVVDNVVKEFYARGVRSFVVADIELIKRLKDALPDCEIQGSCLSNRLTEEELEEERREGVVLHNPSVNIIRDPRQLERNHKAGFAQKVIIFEGCLHQCPDENSKHGHRWYLGRSLEHVKYFCNKPEMASDLRPFFKANWVTVSRLKTLLPFIDVVKLPRSQHLSVLASVKKFIDIFDTGKSYNVAEFISAGYREILFKKVGEIPSDLFDDNFFDVTDSCTMNCEERRCRLCFDMMDKIKRFNADSRSPRSFLSRIKMSFSGYGKKCKGH